MFIDIKERISFYGTLFRKDWLAYQLKSRIQWDRGYITLPGRINKQGNGTNPAYELHTGNQYHNSIVDFLRCKQPLSIITPKSRNILLRSSSFFLTVISGKQYACTQVNGTQDY